MRTCITWHMDMDMDMDMDLARPSTRPRGYFYAGGKSDTQIMARPLTGEAEAVLIRRHELGHVLRYLRGPILVVRRDGEGGGGVAVVRVVHAVHVLALRVVASEAERKVVGLGAAVAEDGDLERRGHCRSDLLAKANDIVVEVT